MNLVFGHCKVANIFDGSQRDYRAFEDPSLIIGSKAKMANILIDFDAQAACDEILRSCRRYDDCRDKPVHSVVRGKGTGKTRCLEELKLCMFSTPHVLPITITFNNPWEIGDLYDNWKLCGVTSAQSSVCLSIIARVASAVYAIPLATSSDLIKNNLLRIDDINSAEVSKGLIPRFLMKVVADGNRIRDANNQVTKVVLMIDETMKFVDFMKRDLKDAHVMSIVSSSVLDHAPLNDLVNTSLVISSLTPTVFWNT